jgi:hypothetical protein
VDACPTVPHKVLGVVTPMRRPRHKLHVSTFPFLAVLLCAMGSLILFLLVMDRRAKIVARHKADDAQATRLAQREKEDAARKAEWEKQRDALHRALLAQQEELEGQADQVKHELADAVKKIDAKQAEHTALQQAATAEGAQLAAHRAELSAKETSIAQSQKQSAQAKADLARLGSQVADLETVLAELKLVKARERQTYSLVPYRGKRGDTRNPIYIECVDRRLIFHPDQKSLAGLDFNAATLRAEVERRAGGLEREAKSRKKDEPPGPPRGPYVLFLVRPDGIASYYHALSFLKGFQIDFGYEVVDQHWVLDFAENRPAGASPWDGGPRTATATVKPPPVRPPLTPQPFTPQPLTPQPLTPAGKLLTNTGNASDAAPSGIGDGPSALGGFGPRGPGGPGAGTVGGVGPTAIDPIGNGGPKSGQPGAGGVPGLVPTVGGATGSSGNAGGPGATIAGSVQGRAVMSGPPGTSTRGSAGSATGGVASSSSLAADSPGLPGAGPGAAIAGPGQSIVAAGPPLNGQGGGSPTGFAGQSPGGTAAAPTGGIASTGQVPYTPRFSGNNGVPGPVFGGPGQGGAAGPGWQGPTTGSVPGSANGGAAFGPPTAGIAAYAGAVGGGAVGQDTANATEASGSPGVPPNGSGQGQGNGGGATGPQGQATGGAAGPTSGGAPSPATAPVSGPASASSANAPPGSPDTPAGSYPGSTGPPPKSATWASNLGGSDAASPSGGDRTGRAALPTVGLPPIPGGADNKTKQSPPPPNLVLGNRDFLITIACYRDHVTVYPGGKQHWWKGTDTAFAEQVLVQNVQDLIAGRQRSVRPGELPYRPLIRFQVAADGLGSYLRVYPRLEFLHVPMSRENLEE